MFQYCAIYSTSTSIHIYIYIYIILFHFTNYYLFIYDYVSIGWLSGDEYIKAVSNMSILINPSLRAWSETFCIVNIEVMSLGIPIVTFGVGGIGEYIDTCSTYNTSNINKENEIKLDKHDYQYESDVYDDMSEFGFEIHKNMILINEANPSTIGNSILYLMNNMSIYISIGIAARKTILDSFTIKMQMKQYDSIYSSIINVEV